MILENADVLRLQAIVTANIAVDDCGCVIRRKLIECRVMIGCFDDHFMSLRGRIFVRKDADAPRIAVAPDFRRRVGFMPGTERAAIGALAKNIRSLFAFRHDQHRIVADHLAIEQRQLRIDRRHRAVVAVRPGHAQRHVLGEHDVEDAVLRRVLRQPFGDRCAAELQRAPAVAEQDE